jgi:hypothetical protein
VISKLPGLIEALPLIGRAAAAMVVPEGLGKGS